MQYNDQARLDPSQMGSSRGTGGKVAVGGGVGLIVMILAMLFGFNPGDLLGSAPAPGGGQQTQDDRFAHCQSGARLVEHHQQQTDHDDGDAQHLGWVQAFAE